MPYKHPKYDLYAWIYLAANFQRWGWSRRSFLKHFSFSEGGPTPLSWLIFLWNSLVFGFTGPRDYQIRNQHAQIVIFDHVSKLLGENLVGQLLLVGSPG